jgi:hypothetical protein
VSEAVTLRSEVMLMAKEVSEGLAALCNSLAQWREHGGGGRGKRIPESVWSEAVAVARVDGLRVTALATRLNYEGLKSRLDETRHLTTESAPAPSTSPSLATPVVPEAASPRRRSTVSATSAQFVSLELGAPGRSRAMTIDLFNRSGERMRIEGAAAMDLTGVVQAFCRTPS